MAIWRAQNIGVREISRRLGRSPSTISRELRRNASTLTYRLDYKASTAQWHTERRARRPKFAKLAANDRLREYVQERLSGLVRTSDGRIVGPPGPEWKGKNKPHRGDRRWGEAWSPEQIAKRLKVDFPDDDSMRDQPRGDLPGPLRPGPWSAQTRAGRLLAHRAGALRVPRARAPQQACAHVTPEVMISERQPRPTTAPCQAMGRRPAHRAGTLRDRHPGRANHHPHDADPPTP